MKDFKYIIIGGGMTGSSAVMGIRKIDPDGTIALFSMEPYKPYNRPPLSKGLWTGKDIESIMRPIEKYNVDLFLETQVKEINRDEKWILTDKQEKIKYQKLLIATGGDPIQMPDMPDGVLSYRTRADFEKLHELTITKQTFCVIGGGFIGSEIAAALTKNDMEVTMIFPEIGISGLLFPDELSNFLNDYYQKQGVAILNGCLVDSILKANDKYLVKYHNINSGRTHEKEFDVVILGLGIKPNIDLAEEAGLDVEEGVVVNEYLQTSDPDIYAAGDVAYFKNLGLGKRMRVEHEDNANTMGLIAGKNMSGEREKYDHMPFFYSDLFDLGYEAVGEMNKDFTIFSDWIEPYKKGTIFYLNNNKIVGLIFWNLWGKVDQGRKVIREGKEYQTKEMKGLFTA
ncbi:MAG: FAD/NAD(P)-binding oxidoreductase [Chloroflexota bacterium]|nr:FAD/NAD(P)-binding oxidoreductase [Chloroflexota bacterium]